MKRIYTKRRIIFLIGILIISNFVITGISLLLIYNKSISTKKVSLSDVVERQKSIIMTLQNEGKNEKEILSFLNKTSERYYGIGKKGEFVIAHNVKDSVIFLFSKSKQTDFKINDIRRKGLPTYLSLQGNTGTIIIKGYNGIKVMAAYTYIPSLEWGLIARVPMSEINYPYFLAISISFFISIILITICILLFVNISNPIINAVYESEKLYRELFENMLNGFSYCKIINNEDEYIDFIYLSVNKSFENLTGLKNVIGKKATEIIPDIQNSDKKLLEMFARVAITGKPEVAEIYLETLQMWFHISVYSPEKEYFIIVFDIITERKMAEIRLNEKNEEIESQNEELNQTIEELNQTNVELEMAKERAEISDRLKTAFLQNISHEIRTPMNAIMGFASLMESNFYNKEKLFQFSKIINQRCSDLLEIINEILDISKIESGQAQVNVEECKLVSLFHEVTLFFNEQMKITGKNHIKFNIQAECGISESIIFTDKIKLKQILINLISNSFKFTKEGEIKAGCKHNNNQELQFYVSDTGIGIPYDKFDYIFERYAQLEQTPGHLYGGTGLGLSIVKGLIELLGGKIWLKSELGKGTTFYFTISYKKSNSKVDEFISYDNLSNDFKFSNQTLLIVEDDIYNAEYLKEILNDKGLKIFHTIYAKEAIEVSESQKIDFILMDIRLPDMDGYRAIRIIRKKNPDVKIIAQTAYAGYDDMVKAIDSGCNEYISKPINKDRLFTIFKKYT